ncbi:COPII coat assembly protein sec16-like [Fopius arisanus]|uniref:COPII coat assembly protein sec16-like n=1 Tax=Fopius arisanus TaxID=64838 RepID=A0A9R1TFF4_9HYME|nr:PREDICTED: COPII coat assembly protein sec16-like [Fopius arisanus]
MWKFMMLTSLSIGICQSQLNFEGSPQTDSTDYTAEESHYSIREEIAKSRELNPPSGRKTDTYTTGENIGPITDARSISPSVKRVLKNEGATNLVSDVGMRIYPSAMRRNETDQTPRHLSSDPLDTFLNSRTPQESQIALDNYLKSHHYPNSSPHSPPTNIINQMTQNTEDNQNTLNIQSNAPQYLSNDQTNINTLNSPPNINQAQLPVSAPQQNGQIINPQVYQTHPLAPVWPLTTFQSRRDVIPIPRRRPIYHHRGAPRYRNRYHAQSRIGPPFIAKPPLSPGPHGTPIYPGDKPIEVIYTKPPGLPGPPNSPGAYNGPSEYFPESEHPPLNKDVYYSQLWAQSYDPHYYNYIAKTGKIKPWLYGKLGKQEEKGFWHELYVSFKKHGMKNMMNPMFLLGLSIPAVTLMLSAMVGKRSFGRAYQDGLTIGEDTIEELAQRIRHAIECYQKQGKCSGDFRS